jgi:hypothetical protein
MKKLMFLFSVLAAAMVVVAGSVACEEKPQSQEEELKFDLMPQQASDEVVTFFKEHLKYLSNSFFTEEKSNKCLVINSAEELKAAMLVDAAIPEIDFEQYTLIIGSYYATAGNSIRYHGINVEPERNVLNLVIYARHTGIAVGEMLNYYYWGLYSKLPDNPVEVNVILE